MAGRIKRIGHVALDRTRAQAITELDESRLCVLADCLIDAQRSSFTGTIAIHRNGCRIVLERLACVMEHCTCTPVTMWCGARA